MTSCLLDTSGFIHLQNGHPVISKAFRAADRVAMNAVVVGELLAGIRASRRHRPNEQFLNSFLSEPQVDLLAIDRATADCYATLKDALRSAGTPVGRADLWIAASALQHGLTILTTDADFLRIPGILVNRADPAGGRPLLRPRSRARP